MRQLSVTFSVPVRLEQLQEAARQAAPSLARLLRRGLPLDAEPSLIGLCCQALGVARQQDWPVAPLTARADGLAPDGAYWLRLDPAHLEVGMGGLMLHPAEGLGLSADEATALTDGLRDLGLDIAAPDPARWYLRLPGVPDLSTTPLDQVVGEYLSSHLPRGRDAGWLMARINEAQMVLHGHAVNRQREACGLPVVNGLWPWGGGILPDAAARVDWIASDHGEVRTLARASGLEPCPMPAGLAALGSGKGLVTLAPTRGDPDLHACLVRLERDWFKPLLRAMQLGRVRRLQLHLIAQPARSLLLGTGAAWRFWR